MLDHVFCDERLAARLVASRSLVEPVAFLGLSDHAPLVVEFDLDVVAPLEEPMPDALLAEALL